VARLVRNGVEHGGALGGFNAEARREKEMEWGPGSMPPNGGGEEEGGPM
jgi:hypothetical protein